MNDTIAEAAKALRYLADNPRPIGGQQRYNAEHLISLAAELTASPPPPLRAREEIARALQNSNSLFAAMLHETRPEQEIEAQIIENNEALSSAAGQEWRDIRDLLEDVITADQVHDWNNTAQDTARDGALARRARKILAALPAPPVAGPIVAEEKPEPKAKE